VSGQAETLRRELEAAQRRIAELEDAVANRETGQKLSELELEESRSALLFMLEDLEKARKQVEQAHREWMAALDAVDDPIFLHDKEFRVMRANRAYQQRAGIPFAEIIGRPYFEVFPKADGPLPGCLKALQGHDGEEEEISLGDAIYRSRTFTVHDSDGAYLYSVHSLEDVTERKRVEEALRKSGDALKEAQRLAAIGNWEWEIRSGRIVWSEEIYRLYGRDPALPPAGYEEVRKYFTPESWERLSAAVEDAMANAKPYECDAEVVRPDGTRRWVTTRGEVTCDAGGQVVDLHGTVQDITERKQNELAMQRANRALRTISAGNETLIHATGETQLLCQMCEVAVQVGGYRMAWIGYARDDAARTIEQMAQAGFEGGCPNVEPLSWGSSGHDACPAGLAIASGETKVVQDILSDPATNPWREPAQQYGYASCIALPLMEEQRAFGVLVLFDDKVDVFDADEIRLLEEMAGDLAFGILTLRVGEAHREHEQRLQKNMMQTVEAIASIVEMRDPYTSGHQARVAELARAIAGQLGLTEEEAQVIHLAGLVHDLGKIRIPAEILSKPGRLSDLEYSLIKTHPQAGYDILKGIDFSWPIAQMVLQHHERLDGSGYPQGLKGEEILLGARILSVADVVEAMASHRPYRPGLGGDAALDEIIRQRGIHYDAQVVDACLSLFRERGYSLPK
jgi:PAS domain S-box-containing protein